MTVSKISREKGHIVRLEFSDGESAVLDLDFCNEKCIHEGDEIPPERLKEYLAESDYIRAKARAVWLLDRYTYTERRLAEKLKAAKFGEEAVKKAVERLKELGLVDDRGLSARYAEDCARRGISKREAYYKLYSKGFDEKTVRAALDSADFDEAEQINALLERKYARALNSGETEKVYAALVRKGFSYGAVRDALKKYNEELKYSGDE